MRRHENILNTYHVYLDVCYECKLNTNTQPAWRLCQNRQILTSTLVSH